MRLAVVRGRLMQRMRAGRDGGVALGSQEAANAVRELGAQGVHRRIEWPRLDRAHRRCRRSDTLVNDLQQRGVRYKMLGVMRFTIDARAAAEGNCGANDRDLAPQSRIGPLRVNADGRLVKEAASAPRIGRDSSQNRCGFQLPLRH